MVGSDCEQALAHYGAQLSILEQADMPPAPECVLAVLVARDAVHAALQDRTQVPLAALLLLTQLDSRLRQRATTITPVIDLTAWRDSFHPPQEAWWWFMSCPAQPRRWDRFDWLWNTASVACLTMALSLVVDISGRFLSDGPDTLGAFAVIGQSVLTLLAAGGALTHTGREASERILTSLRLPKHFWAEVQLSFVLMLLGGLLLLYSALPRIASTYNNRGVEHYVAGRLASAESAFNRALKLDPDAVGAHYNLGRLYEALEDFERAQVAYKTALKGGLDAAYNNLARLYVLHGKYAQAEALLLDGLDRAQDHDVQYSMLKNLGWARLALKDYSRAESALHQAIAVQEDKAPAYCLLAQVLDAQQEPVKGREAWEQCLRRCSRRHSPEESKWCIEARNRLALVGEKP